MIFNFKFEFLKGLQNYDLFLDWQKFFVEKFLIFIFKF